MQKFDLCFYIASNCRVYVDFSDTDIQINNNNILVLNGFQTRFIYGLINYLNNKLFRDVVAQFRDVVSQWVKQLKNMNDNKLIFEISSSALQSQEQNIQRFVKTKTDDNQRILKIQKSLISFDN